MARALVIVDIQMKYSKAANPVVSSVCRLAEAFGQNHFPIINVRFRHGSGGNDMLPLLNETLKKLDFVKQVWKTTMDGSKEVDAELSNYNSSVSPEDKIDEVLICGVNTSECVAATLNGLQQLGYNVTIVEDACGDHFTSLSQLQITAWKVRQLPITQVEYYA
jgi:nicotinamidase-related amidase